MNGASKKLKIFFEIVNLAVTKTCSYKLLDYWKDLRFLSKNRAIVEE